MCTCAAKFIVVSLSVCLSVCLLYQLYGWNASVSEASILDLWILKLVNFCPPQELFRGEMSVLCKERCSLEYCKALAMVNDKGLESCTKPHPKLQSDDMSEYNIKVHAHTKA